MSNQADKDAMVWCRLDPCMYSLPLILHAAGEATYAAPADSAATIATTAAAFHGRYSASLNFTCLSILISVSCADFLFGGET
ncbi:unnamed protein product [Ectocarpus sp. 12 AP-2014]